MKRWRKKIKPVSRLIRRKRLTGATGFDPKRNHVKDTSETGTLQPAIPKARYSLEVRSSPRMFFKVSATNAVPSAMNNRIPKISRPWSAMTAKIAGIIIGLKDRLLGWDTMASQWYLVMA